MKKLIPLLLTIFMLVGTQVALGATETKMSGGGVVSPQFLTIAAGQCTIVNIGNGSVNMSGSTSTYYPVGQIGLQLSLQYLSGGQWKTVPSATYSYYRYNSSYVSGGQLLGVSSGYYYRVFAQHTSLDGGISESGQSYSEAIYIQ